MSHLLLKARPTPAQLADRLRVPQPDGLELYLDTADLLDAAAMDATVAAVETCLLPTDFALLIEGPVRSLDGQFFDLARDAEADREVVRRLAALTRRLGARAINVHVIAPTAQPGELTAEARRRGLEHALPLAGYFAEAITRAGAIPTVENMPPVLRMRESSFYYSAIGMPAEDLVWLCERIPGLRTTLDLSHAGLYVNSQRLAAGEAVGQEDGGCRELFEFVRGLPTVPDVQAYADTLGSTLLTCHVSNARGLLGEGEPYDRGDLQLDALIRELAPRASYFVTETLESDPNQAVEMRRALASMRQALQAA